MYTTQRKPSTTIDVKIVPSLSLDPINPTPMNDEEGEAILQPNIQFAFLCTLMGLQKEKERVKDFPNRLVARKQRRFKYPQFSSSLFVPPLLWPPLEKYRFPDWREDLVESCFARLTHFLSKYANYLSNVKGSTVPRTSH